MDYLTGADICVTFLHVDAIETRTAWEIDLNVAHDYVRYLAARHGDLPDWAMFTCEGAGLITLGRLPRIPGSNICVTLLHADGSEVRAAWEIHPRDAARYVDQLRIIHGKHSDSAALNRPGLAPLMWQPGAADGLDEPDAPGSR
ncbi:hypothetical protein ACQEVF_56630 [Nonomuraea polychroma]|uniref:hypothetical protein n=1 Tax=Nonomuraea polychroma TaxID=46176 RepID=UPI003D8E3C18